MKRSKLLMAFLGVAVMVVAQRASIPKTQDKLALAEENAKQMLLLMDTNKNGKISKQEWMKFMDAEFDRLDKNKKGELDPKELQQSGVSVKRVPPASLGK